MLAQTRLLRAGSSSYVRITQSLSLQKRRSLISLRSFATQEASVKPTVEPFRKALKSAAKSAKAKSSIDLQHHQSAQKSPSCNGLDPDVLDRWELTVGIEIHAQLNTNHKLFSDAQSVTEAETNSLTAVFDLSMPGSQPVFQLPVLVPALRAAAALGCEIQEHSTFDRKHYFYQDQPAGYQITQYYNPFALHGQVELYDHDGIAPEDGKSITVGIKQIQLEQDTAKSILQPPDQVLLDFNRVGHPLIEIISLPQIHHAQSAAAYVRKISQILTSVDAVTTGMELGGLRADVNVSVRRKGDGSASHSYSGVTGLGQRTEIKNLSSFKAVEEAIIAERDRQIRLIEQGGKVDGETRGWTIGSTETMKLRGKEGEVDYRYMPDPDILPLLLDKTLIHHIRKSLPVLPDDQYHDLCETWGISSKDAKTLIALEDGVRVHYFHDVVAQFQQGLAIDTRDAGKFAANWVLHELGGLFSSAELDFDVSAVSAESMSFILKALHNETITGKAAKKLLSLVFHGDLRPIPQIIDDEGLALQKMSLLQYQDWARTLVEENPSMAEKVRKGQSAKIQWFVGQMMRKSKGTIDAGLAKQAVEKVLLDSS